MGEELTCEGGKEEPLDLTLCWSEYLLELEKTPLGLGDGLCMATSGSQDCSHL